MFSMNRSPSKLGFIEKELENETPQQMKAYQYILYFTGIYMILAVGSLMKGGLVGATSSLKSTCKSKNSDIEFSEEDELFTQTNGLKQERMSVFELNKRQATNREIQKLVSSDAYKRAMQERGDNQANMNWQTRQKEERAYKRALKKGTQSPTDLSETSSYRSLKTDNSLKCA